MKTDTKTKLFATICKLCPFCIAAGVDFEVATRPATMLPSAIKYASAIVLITILVVGAISKKKE